MPMTTHAMHTGETTRPSEVARPGNRTADRSSRPGCATTGTRSAHPAPSPPAGCAACTRLGEDWLLFREPTARCTCWRTAARTAAPRSPSASTSATGSHARTTVSRSTATAPSPPVPGMPGCNLEGKQLVPSLPLRESGGAVLAYFGDDKHPSRAPSTCPTRSPTPTSRTSSATPSGTSPWRFAVRTCSTRCTAPSCTASRTRCPPGETTAQFRIRETERGFVFEKTDQQGVNFDWVEYCRTGIDWVDLDIPYPPTAGPGGPFGIVGMVTPIDADRSAVFFWRYRRVTGWQRDVWRFLYKTSSRSGTGTCSSRTGSCSKRSQRRRPGREPLPARPRRRPRPPHVPHRSRGPGQGEHHRLSRPGHQHVPVAGPAR